MGNMRLRSKQERWRFLADGKLKIIVASSRNIAYELAKKWYPDAKEIVDAPELVRDDSTIAAPAYPGETNIILAPPEPPMIGAKVPMFDDDGNEIEDNKYNVNPSEDDGSEEFSYEEDDEEVTEEPMRKRGRPSSIDEDDTKRRGRGRPRVNPLPDPNAPKRKRGRPRIHPLPDPNAPKRPRGRPRKNPV